MLPGLIGLIGFSGGPVVPIDDGDTTAPTSGAGGTVHTFSSIVATGPDLAIVVTSRDSGTPWTVASATLNGNAMDVAITHGRATGDNGTVTILLIEGVSSGDLVVTFNGNTDMSHITIVSLSNLLDIEPIDTDFADSNSSLLTMAALTNPGDEGIIICGYTNSAPGTEVTWGNITLEISDTAIGTIRHAASWTLGDPASDITAVAGADDNVLVAVSLR